MKKERCDESRKVYDAKDYSDQWHRWLVSNSCSFGYHPFSTTSGSYSSVEPNAMVCKTGVKNEDISEFVNSMQNVL